ncbi:RNA polymerase sigma factor SigJ [Nakamurella endophytica]|uniref:RNA polymerase sigma24 factor n=1 Tax=Nakamurella endophytica TaxID=1748367 RepID=A0A917SYU5_9ACTN|nr:RNA polymerase sigma factor SigJ [Nakamurella endophytica]GGM03073.1 RNA polymerase sigma24 factor [Nakamurella endophytica]
MSGHPAADPAHRSAALAADYESSRDHLVRVAYAILGSRAEAEDVVSDVWLRLVAADRRDPVLDVEAWATVAVARAALDALRSARVRREVYTGPWLPEPVLGSWPPAGGADAGADPADRVTLDDEVGYALLVVLETLTPAERTAWVLHDLFGLPFTDVAAAVGRTPAAVRQLAARARGHVAAGAPRVGVDRAEHTAAVTRFLEAAAGGDLAALMRALDPDVVLTSDGGGHVSAARRPVRGRDKVARFLLGTQHRFGQGQQAELVSVNGALGLALFADRTLTTVLSLTVSGGLVRRVDMIRSPVKLPRVAPGVGTAGGDGR